MNREETKEAKFTKRAFWESKNRFEVPHFASFAFFAASRLISVFF